MENQDPVAEVMAQDDQEPDVEAHDSAVEDVTSDPVAAQDDQEPDVEAHGSLVVEDSVNAAADSVA